MLLLARVSAAVPGGATPALPCLSRLGGAVLRFSGRRAETFKGPWPAGLGGVSHLRSTDCWTTVPMEPSFIRLPSDAWNASLQLAEQAGRADFRRLACRCQRSRRKRKRMRTTTVRGHYMSSNLKSQRWKCAEHQLSGRWPQGGALEPAECCRRRRSAGALEPGAEAAGW